MTSMTVTIIAALLMLLGLIGTVVPGIPGLGFVWIGALVYGIFEGFNTFGAIAFSLITALVIIGFIASYLVPAQRAGSAGANFNSIALGVGLAIVGAFLIPVVGIFIGGVGGIYLGERARGIAHPEAWRATTSTLIGFGIGALIEIIAAAICIALWLGWVISN